jgi:hypothetical protein
VSFFVVYDTSSGNFDFDSSLALTIILTGLGTETSIGIGYGDYITEDYFVLVPDGLDPNTSEDYILGIGEFINSAPDPPNTTPTPPSTEDINIVYYGTAEDVPTLKIWRETYNDETGDLEYVLVTGDTVQAL